MRTLEKLQHMRNSVNITKPDVKRSPYSHKSRIAFKAHKS